jgi:hypothetical protein
MMAVVEGSVKENAMKKSRLSEPVDVFSPGRAGQV